MGCCGAWMFLTLFYVMTWQFVDWWLLGFDLPCFGLRVAYCCRSFLQMVSQ